VVVFLRVFITKFVCVSILSHAYLMSAHLTLFHFIFLIIICGQKKNITKFLNVQIFLPSHYGPVGIMTRLTAELSNLAGWFPTRATEISVLRNIEPGPETHPTSYAKHTGPLSQEYSGLYVKLTSHLHLAPRLRVSGATPRFPPTSLYSVA
jgi:hypothetical protein